MHACPRVHACVRVCSCVFARACVCVRARGCVCMCSRVPVSVRVWLRVSVNVRICSHVSVSVRVCSRVSVCTNLVPFHRDDIVNCFHILLTRCANSVPFRNFFSVSPPSLCQFYVFLVFTCHNFVKFFILY